MDRPRTHDEWAAIEHAATVALSRKDRNAFMEYVFGVHQAEIHYKLQAHLSTGRRQGAELPRDHGKTTQALGGLAYEIGRDHNIRIKIVSESDDVAKGRAKALREVLESPRYLEVFPDVKPGRTWADEKLSVQRSIVSPDETVQAYGVRSSVIGGRADLILFDDVVGPNAIRSEAYRSQIEDKMDNAWLLLLEPEARAWYIATPWHTGDYTGRLRESNTWSWKRWPVGPHLEPVWPEKWDADKLRFQQEDLGSIAFARAYFLQPLSDADAPIKAHWFRYYDRMEVDPASLYRFLGVDLAISKRKGAAFTVFVDVGKDMDGRLYVLRVLRERMDFPGAVDTFRRWTAGIPYRGIGVETVAFQRAFSDSIRVPDSATLHEFASVESKHERAALLSVPIEKGLVYLLGQDGVVHPSQQVLFDECTLFPVAKYKDTLDALGYAIEVAQNTATGPGLEDHVYTYESDDETSFVGRRDTYGIDF